jgi:hypothetical protein
LFYYRLTSLMYIFYPLDSENMAID